KLFYPSHCPVSRRSRFSLTAQKTEGESNQFFVALNGSLSCRSSGGDQFLFHGRGKDRGERCAASGAFNGSSPTANLVSIIKGQGSRGNRFRRVKRLVARASLRLSRRKAN